MKTITVSDEVYEFLKSCQQELNTQNNRITANPIFGFQIDKEVASINENECCYINEDHTDRITDSETAGYISDLAEYILERYDYGINAINDILDNECEEIIECRNQNEDETIDDYILYLKNLVVNYLNDNSFSLNTIVEYFNISCFWYEKIPIMYDQSVSLFESDMQAHLNMNKHNMPESVRTYVYSNYRTPKMEQLRNVLMKEIEFGENSNEI